MGLRCSLLGHDYGDSFVERDREERGNEVVVTERELKECSRCGAEKVTTENTEVRSLQATSGADSGSPGADVPDADGASARDSTQGAAGASPDRPQSGGAPADTGDTGSAFSSPADAIEQAESGTADDAVTADAGGEDAVILDDDADDGPGSDQWDEPADPDAEPAADTEPATEDDEVEFIGSDASTGREPAEPEPTAEQTEQSGGAASAESTDRGRGEWPDRDAAEDEGFDATPAGDSAESTFEFGAEEGGVVESDTGFTSAGPLDNAERTEADDLDYTLYCPECGFDRYAGGSSLRAGDICPECKKGYLAEDR